MEFNLSPGDRVKLRLALEELEGIVLESSDSSIVLLKLESGYNIGIPKENILASRIIKKYQTPPPSASFQIPHKNSLPNIGLIITGGTIASKLDTKTMPKAAVFDIF